MGPFRRAQMLGLMLAVGLPIRQLSAAPSANMSVVLERSAEIWEQLESCSDVGDGAQCQIHTSCGALHVTCLHPSAWPLWPVLQRDDGHDCLQHAPSST